MKFLLFLEEKIFFLLCQFTFLLVMDLFFFLFLIPIVYLLLFDFLFLFFLFLYLTITFCSIERKSKRIENQLYFLDEKYLIAEVIEKPQHLENQIYYYVLKSACKAMNDKITILENEKDDYQEYIESFAHEIKTPIAVLSLEAENKKDDFLKEEIRKIENLIEQMLYYARMKTTEKDYFVKQLNLEDVVHYALLSYKDYLLKRKILLEVESFHHVIYTDEKWLLFILSQIIQNAIKYQNKIEKKIIIKAVENPNNVVLHIKDNGCGINNNHLTRVFEPSFTGDNRKNKSATGMGLYLAKKLCDKLGLQLLISSKENEYTHVKIIFPKGKLHDFD